MNIQVKVALPYKHRADLHLYKRELKRVFEKEADSEIYSGAEGKRRKREVEAFYSRLMSKYQEAFWISHEEVDLPKRVLKERDQSLSAELEVSVSQLAETFSECRQLKVRLEPLRLGAAGGQARIETEAGQVTVDQLMEGSLRARIEEAVGWREQMRDRHSRTMRRLEVLARRVKAVAREVDLFSSLLR